VKTEIFKVNPFNPQIKYIKKAAEYIKKGEVIAFPTETVYGLGGDATNKDSILKIFKIKERPLDNPIIVHIADLKDLEFVAEDIPEIAFKLIKKFWPGPLTLILKRSKNIPKETSAGLETVAVRMPSHPVALSLIKYSNVPIAAPSANKSGKPSPTKASHVLDDFKDKIPLILDAGHTLYGVESTVIDLTKVPPILLRPGALPAEDIKKVVENLVIDEIAYGFKKILEKEKVTSPGLKYRHYAPEKPLILVEGNEESKIKKINELISYFKKNNKKVGLLIAYENKKFFVNDNEIEILGRKDNLFEIAYKLFEKLRKIDKKNIDVIIAEGFEDKGIGLTIMNRLRKAATERIVV